MGKIAYIFMVSVPQMNALLQSNGWSFSLFVYCAAGLSKFSIVELYIFWDMDVKELIWVFISEVKQVPIGH